MQQGEFNATRKEMVCNNKRVIVVGGSSGNWFLAVAEQAALAGSPRRLSRQANHERNSERPLNP